jgi:hypothetical protein
LLLLPFFAVFDCGRCLLPEASGIAAIDGLNKMELSASFFDGGKETQII